MKKKKDKDKVEGGSDVERRDNMKEVTRFALQEVKHFKSSMRNTLNVGTFSVRTLNSPRSTWRI